MGDAAGFGIHAGDHLRLVGAGMVAWARYAGGNFSGRSLALQTELKAHGAPRHTAFLGPFAETCLSGFAITPKDELRLYGQRTPGGPWADLFSCKEGQPISTLSGGEQVMLALTVLSGRSDVRCAGVDCALEQLDANNRQLGLDLLGTHVREAIHLVDHRLRPEDFPASEVRIPQAPAQRRYAFAPQAAAGADIPVFAQLPRRPAERIRSVASHDAPAPSIEMRDLGFAYTKPTPVFQECTVHLEPGRVYRLFGPNGSGKSTFFKLLCGLLKPQSGALLVAGQPYRPFANGNALVAYAMQNPDEQWVAITLDADLATRIERQSQVFGDAQRAIWARYFRMFDVDLTQATHVLDYPRALRKRLSWYWALSGIMPWSVLDEPTLGQDDATVSALADRIGHLAAAGRGVVIVTHDRRLMDALRPVVLRIADLTVREDNPTQ